MTSSHVVLTRFKALLVVVFTMTMLQACSHVPEKSQTIVKHQNAAPLLLGIPEARVQHIDQSAEILPASAKLEVLPKDWIFNSAPEGGLPEASLLPPDIYTRDPAHTDLSTVKASGSLDVRDNSVAVIDLTTSVGSHDLIASVRPASIYKVILYSSPTTSAFFAVLGVDHQQNIAVWEAFLDRHEISHATISKTDELSQLSNGVLILPSSVALDETERNSIADFRKRGGSVLTTWLSGVRGAVGEWTGFDFMTDTLNTRVVGDTRHENDDVYINPHGDNPVTHQLPAGLRIWTERAEGWYPLRLSGVNSAAQIMDWSRTVHSDKPDSVISFNERLYGGGHASRAVVLGYPERLWNAADRTSMDAIAYDALTWLARRPSTYLGSWPEHKRSAMVMALDEANGVSDSEYRYAELCESLGGHASYFVLTEQLKDIQERLQSLHQRGHEIAFMGDGFESYAGLSKFKQSKRIARMLHEAKSVAPQLAIEMGIHPPMEGYDQTTIEVLAKSNFKYIIGDYSSSESRLPSFIGDENDDMILLPRTQSGPDDMLTDENPNGFKDFLAEFRQSERMGGVNVVRIPSDSAMDETQWNDFSKMLHDAGKHMWTANAHEVTTWWRERERIKVTLDDSVTPALLTVKLSGEKALLPGATVLVNLPYLNAELILLPDDLERAPVSVMRRDVWRADIELGNLPPGEHHWFLKFTDTQK